MMSSVMTIPTLTEPYKYYHSKKGTVSDQDIKCKFGITRNGAKEPKHTHINHSSPKLFIYYGYNVQYRYKSRISIPRST